MTTYYKIVRGFLNDPERVVIKTRLTLEQAREHCRDPETSSRTCTTESAKSLTRNRGPWFDGYEEE